MQGLKGFIHKVTGAFYPRTALTIHGGGWNFYKSGTPEEMTPPHLPDGVSTLPLQLLRATAEPPAGFINVSELMGQHPQRLEEVFIGFRCLLQPFDPQLAGACEVALVRGVGSPA